MTCEKCWRVAYVRAQTLGGSQADHYRDLHDEWMRWQHDHPDTERDQDQEKPVSEFDYDDPIEHGMLLFVDIDGRPFAKCECGWVSRLASDAENAEGMWDHHISTLDDDE